jgi:MoxR-like ATPase
MLDRLHANLEVVIKGKSDPLQTLVAAFAAGGSVLMEDVPGVGKTTLAKALAKSIRAKYNRVQFTPDLLPADILGSSVYNPSSGDFTFHKGPVFSNVLLADEINRASPRTQSALLEAMSEHQATIEGNCYILPRPFFVIATQNPLEFHGTYPLPEAQLDRFMIRLNLGYPDAQAAREILFSQALEHPLETLEPVLTGDDIQALQQAVRAVHVEESIAGYLVELVERTRQDQRLKLGVSPRGALHLFLAAQASAAQDGRDFVLPDDVQRMAPWVLTHRVLLTSKAKYSGVQQADIIADSLSAVAVPT